ncbi:MAG: nucleotidyltransferase domain-containing protein [Eubacteriales bacterium]|nr:nucleotidyltransferase domain-containing protein [Eubacteriales bacterium]
MKERDIQKEIQDSLDQIERKYGVRILLAVESGSRAWGFASPDSDYDVRFIYMHEPAEYLRVDPVKDVIEWQLDEVLDINGWDVKKALLAYGKGNPNIIEWANSNVIYRKNDAWDSLKQTALHYFSEKAALCHYYGTAKKTLKMYLMDDQVRYKKYFYALRPLLCCRWIEAFHEAPPVEFDRLLELFGRKNTDGKDFGGEAFDRQNTGGKDFEGNAFDRKDIGGKDPDSAGGQGEPARFSAERAAEEGLTGELYAAILDLLSRKTVTEEKDLNPHMPEIIGFIRSECERQKELSDAAPDDRRHDYSELNTAFRKLLKY